MDRREERPALRRRLDLGEKGDVAGNGRAQRVPGRPLRKRIRQPPHRGRHVVERVRVAKLAVVPGDTADVLPHMVRIAVGVNDLELSADEAAPSVVGMR